MKEIVPKMVSYNKAKRKVRKRKRVANARVELTILETSKAALSSKPGSVRNHEAARYNSSESLTILAEELFDIISLAAVALTVAI